MFPLVIHSFSPIFFLEIVYFFPIHGCFYAINILNLINMFTFRSRLARRNLENIPAQIMKDYSSGTTK